MKCSVAAIQFHAHWGDKEYNRKTAAALVEKAAKAGAELVVLPELWNSGYDASDFRHLPEQAEPLTGPSVQLLKDLAVAHHLTIGGGSVVEDRHGKLYNTSVCISPQGQVEEKYRKAHLFLQEKDYFSPGDEWTMVEDVPLLAGLSLGMAICYDLRFPEFFRNMALRGSRFFSVPMAWPRVRLEEYLVLARSRALENRSILIAANHSGPEMSGHSAVISQTGAILAQCGDEDGFALAEIDMDSFLHSQKHQDITDRRQFLDEIDDNLL